MLRLNGGVPSLQRTRLRSVSRQKGFFQGISLECSESPRSRRLKARGAIGAGKASCTSCESVPTNSSARLAIAAERQQLKAAETVSQFRKSGISLHR